MAGSNQHVVRIFAENLRQVQTLYETCPIYAQPNAVRKQAEEVVITGSIFCRENAETVLKACERYWHFSYLQRHQANEFLIREVPGSFIVRRASKMDSYALSIRLPPHCADPVTHYLIVKEPRGYVVQGSKLPFPTLYALLGHFCFKQSGGMPCLLRPPNVPIAKSSLDPTRAGYATLEEAGMYDSQKRRIDGRAVSKMIRSQKPLAGDESPPPLPPPRHAKGSRNGACSRSRTTYEDISITAADESGRQERGVAPGSVRYVQRLSSVYGQLDQLAQQVAEMINNDESPHDEAMEIEDFEVEVSASDDSGDEYDNHKEHTSLPTRQESSGELEARRMATAKEPPVVPGYSPDSPSLQPQGRARKTYHALPSRPTSIGSHHSPVPPRSPMQSPEPNPPPLPPRLSKSFHDNRDLPPKRTSSPSLDHSSLSPLPPRPPKPYRMYKQPHVDLSSSPRERAPSVENRQSMSESALQEWTRTGSTGELPRKADLQSAASSASSLTSSIPVSTVDPLVTSSSSGHKTTESEPEGDSIMSDSGVHAAKQQGSKGRGYVKQKKARKKLKLRFHVKTPAEKIAELIHDLSQSDSGQFAQVLSGFCNRAKHSHANYQMLLQETRQCMDQLRKVLLKEHAAELDKRGRKRCKLFDEVLERTLQDVVIGPLYERIMAVMEEHFENSKDLQILQTNIAHGKLLDQGELGIRDNIVVPDGASMAAIAETLKRMEQTTSAMVKLELLLEAVKLTYDNVHDARDPTRVMKSLGADDFLPIFVWVLLQCECGRAELEAEFMWGLVHPSLLNGEGGYYLTTLTSAVQVVKQLKFDNMALDEGKPENKGLAPMSECMAFLEVFVEHPVIGSRTTSALIPVHSNLDAASTCQLLVSRYQGTLNLNPDEYHLYAVEGNQETELPPDACPQLIRAHWPSQEDGVRRYFAFLRRRQQ